MIGVGMSSGLEPWTKLLSLVSLRALTWFWFWVVASKLQLSAVDGAVVADVTNAAGVRIPSEVIVLEVEVTEVVLRITLSNLKKVLLLGFSELEILEALHQDFEFPALYIMQKTSNFSPHE